ncbi:DUF2270 domain-containing protein [Persicimonas caeni]|uniref:DUF2270 domain-containing protein n=2 Tax=Persicimonas caeni TaxID=2292766 RepID=A0A4Y6PPR6_PERCE|nr:DUF2270 domain-containing protein [Persicimonas caeni]QED31543.1 DUF2270 domain-containing protein [Persicimonas caeni]
MQARGSLPALLPADSTLVWFVDIISPMREPSTAVVHFYRAALAHADVWRQRLDTTTNWAVVTNAAIISFVLSSASTPHFILLLLVLLDLFFLLMESRRYQIYDIWHNRIRLMHQYVFAEALSGEARWDEERVAEKLGELADDLGHTVPRISLFDAIGFRIRRNYFYVLLVTLGAWFLKLDIHPSRPTSTAEFIGRAEFGPLGGTAVMTGAIALLVFALILAVRAPSDRLINWTQQPSPFRRLVPTGWLYRPPTAEEIEKHPENDEEKD